MNKTYIAKCNYHILGRGIIFQKLVKHSGKFEKVISSFLVVTHIKQPKKYITLTKSRRKNI